MADKFYLNILNECNGDLKNRNIKAKSENSNLIAGRVNGKNQNTVFDLINIELEKNLLKVIYSENTFSNLLDYLENNSSKFNIFTTGLYKFDKKGKNVFERLKFLKRKFPDKKTIYNNFCLIFQSKDLENIKFNKYEFNANSVQFVFDINLENKTNISYELQRIHFMDYNSDLEQIADNDPNMNLHKLLNYDVVFCCKGLNCDSNKCKLKNKKDEFKMSNDTVLSLTKPIRFFEDKNEENDEIKISETKYIINKFFKIYNNKSNDSNFYLINLGESDEVLENGSSSESKSKKIDFKNGKIYLWKRKDIGFEALDNKPILSNEKDNSSSAVKIKYSKNNENFDDLVNNYLKEKNKLSDDKKNKLKQKVKYDQYIQNLNDEIKTIKNNINQINVKIEEEQKLENTYTKFILKRQEFFDNWNELNKLSDELKSKKSKAKDDKKNETKSITKKHDELSLKSEKIIKEIRELEEEFNNIDNYEWNFSDEKEKIKIYSNKRDQSIKNLKAFENEINEFQKNLYDKDFSIKNLNKNILKLEEEVKKIDNLISVLDIKAKNMDLLFSYFKEQNLQIFKIENINLIPNEKEEEVEINLEKIDFLKEEDFKNLDSNKKIRRFPISQLSVGEKTIIKRSKFSFDDLFYGYYKQPLMLPAIYNPFVVNTKKGKNEILENTIQKYKLNNKQEESLRKAIYSDSLFLLQGPPGTGKTQLICSMIDYYQQKNKNLMLTSSTHEAIDNAFDRYAKKEPINPNIFAVKITSGNKKRDSSYSIEKLSKRYKKAIVSEFNLMGIEENSNKDNKIFKNQIKGIINLIKSDQNYKNYLDELLKELKDTSELKIDEFFRYNSLMRKFLQNLKEIINNSESVFISGLKENNAFSYEAIEKIKFELNENIYGIQKIKKEIFEKYQKFNQTIDSSLEENNDDIDERFNKFILEKKLINLFGLTTTSNTVIEYNGIEYDLATDYPIETTIMDESSKSNLYEVINRCLNSSKVILCGDAYQLPPVVNFSDDLIERASKDFTDENDEVLDKERIKESLCFPYFEKVINILNDKKHRSQYSFEFLDEQHRFPEPITKLVNVLYESKNQALKTAKKDSEFKEYDFSEINTRIEDKKLAFISTDKIVDKYFNKLKKYNSSIKSNENFDNYELVDDGIISFVNEFNNKKSSRGLINQYNAIVISEFISKIINNEKVQELLKVKKDFADIGVICLTRNQSNLIKLILKTNYPKIYDDYIKTKKIAVDTIDNFQGRECEIVIVDLIRAKLQGKKQELTKEWKLDFLKNYQRLNVALSRSKNYLFVFGSFNYYKSLVDANDLKKYIKKYEEENELINVSEIYRGKHDE